jgi:hypothetical protein
MELLPVLAADRPAQHRDPVQLRDGIGAPGQRLDDPVRVEMAAIDHAGLAPPAKREDAVDLEIVQAKIVAHVGVESRQRRHFG